MCKLRILREINSGKFESSITAILITCFSFLILQILLHLCNFIRKIQSHKTCQKCQKIWIFYIKLYLEIYLGQSIAQFNTISFLTTCICVFVDVAVDVSSSTQCDSKTLVIFLRLLRLHSVEITKIYSHSKFAQKFRKINAFSTKFHYMSYFHEIFFK